MRGVPGCRKGTMIGCASRGRPCAHIVRRGRFRVFNRRVCAYPGAMIDRRCSARCGRNVRPCCPMGSSQGGTLTRTCQRLTSGRSYIVFNNELKRCGCCSVTPIVRRMLTLRVL